MIPTLRDVLNADLLDTPIEQPTEENAPFGYVVYAMETGYTKGARRYAIQAESASQAVQKVAGILEVNPAIQWDNITFEVFPKSQGREYRYERTLRQVGK